jgi:hypothetical protein
MRPGDTRGGGGMLESGRLLGRLDLSSLRLAHRVCSRVNNGSNTINALARALVFTAEAFLKKASQ